jgi:predicted extracellular nuclease
VVISEVYGGGGNTGATYTHDYVELHNPTDAPVCLDGWRVEYVSASGTSPVTPVTTLSGQIAAGGSYLVQQAAGSGGTTPLPTPNAVGTNAMSATNGRVQLVGPTGLVDLVGYGSSLVAEGSPTPALSNTTAAIRNGGGTVDTDVNAADFTVGSPDPDAGPVTPCDEEPPPPSGCDVAATH